MSGGHYDYKQYQIDQVADQLEEDIKTIGTTVNKETLTQMKTGLKHIRIAAIYTRRLDYFLSGDDGEESFHARLFEELMSCDAWN